MADDPFAFIQAVFHLILFIVVHGQRTRSGIKAPRNRIEPQARNSATCASDQVSG